MGGEARHGGGKVGDQGMAMRGRWKRTDMTSLDYKGPHGRCRDPWGSCKEVSYDRPELGFEEKNMP